MKRTRGAMVIAGTMLAMIAASCAGRATSTGAAAVRLVDLYKAEMLRGSAPPAARTAKKIE